MVGGQKWPPETKGGSMPYKVLKEVKIAANPQGSKHRILKKGKKYDNIPPEIANALLKDETEGPWLKLIGKTDNFYETKIETPETKEEKSSGWTPKEKPKEKKKKKKKT